MIRGNIQQVCDNYKDIENYDKAIADPDNLWVIHHRKEIDNNGRIKYMSKDLKQMGLYYHRPADELIFLLPEEHRKMHWESGLRELYSERANKFWSKPKNIRRVKERFKRKRENGEFITNIEQLSSDEAYREYQKAYKEKWYNENREKWNTYTRINKLIKKDRYELLALLEKHENSILIAEENGDTERINKLKKFIKEIKDVLKKVA